MAEETSGKGGHSYIVVSENAARGRQTHQQRAANMPESFPYGLDAP